MPTTQHARVVSSENRPFLTTVIFDVDSGANLSSDQVITRGLLHAVLLEGASL